jgi:hypothetical protein
MQLIKVEILKQMLHREAKASPTHFLCEVSGKEEIE